MFKPTPLSKGEILQKLNLPADKPIMLFFGFVRPYKGLSILIDALEIIISKGQEVHLLIAGEFWEDREKYDTQIKAAGLEKYVHIFDYFIPDDEAAVFFEAADLFVAPYTGGTQSGALKAAMGFGMPAVISDLIDDPLIKDFQDQIRIVSVNNVHELAEGICKQLPLPKLKSESIDKILDFSWQEIAKVLIN